MNQVTRSWWGQTRYTALYSTKTIPATKVPITAGIICSNQLTNPVAKVPMATTKVQPWPIPVVEVTTGTSMVHLALDVSSRRPRSQRQHYILYFILIYRNCSFWELSHKANIKPIMLKWLDLQIILEGNYPYSSNSWNKMETIPEWWRKTKFSTSSNITLVISYEHV